MMSELKLDETEEGKMIFDLSSFTTEADISMIVHFFAFLTKSDESDEENLLELVSTFTRYGEFVEFNRKIQESLTWVTSYPLFKEKMDTVKEAVGKKFPILVLIDLGGSIFFRTEEKDVGEQFDFKFKRFKYFYRPGYGETLLALTKHPRTVVAFYSSMMRKTITPVMHELLQGEVLEGLKTQIGIFDREYCTQMRHFKYYSEISDEPYDTFRDLQKVFDDKFCKDNGFNASNTLLIDSDSKKVQLWLDNSLITEPYLKEDVNQTENPFAQEG